MHRSSSSTAEEYKCLEATDLEDFCPNYSGADICAPDTFESMPGTAYLCHSLRT